MYTREIPRTLWPDFFKSFSQEHRDWIAEVEVLGSDLGVQTETRDLKLEGITIEPEDEVIEIMVGEEAGDHITHTISVPESVWVEQSDDGHRTVLKIDSRDGRMALVRFSADALAGSELSLIAGATV